MGKEVPFEQALSDAWADDLVNEKKRSGSYYRHIHERVYASGWHECTRKMALDCCKSDQLAPFSADTLAKFDRGNKRERDLLAKLNEIGPLCKVPFTIQEQQKRVSIKGRNGQVVISGRVEFRFAFGRYPSAPAEIKSWSVHMTDSVKSFADLLRGRWMAAGARQLLIYMAALDEPLGYFILDRPGLPMILPVRLSDHQDLVDGFKAQAQEVIDCLEKRERERKAGFGPKDVLPPFTKNRSLCKTCDHFGVTCGPPMIWEGLQILEDPGREAGLKRWHELHEGSKEFARIDKRLKEDFRGVEHLLCGESLLTGKWSKNKKTFRLKIERI